MGGLAGYPFTGSTGLGAFLSHIPDGGGGIIFYGPHIGISGSGTAGFVKRVGQKKQTTCCGALQATLTTLQDSTDPTSDRDLDGQMWSVESELSAEREAFLESETPIFAITDVMYRRIDERIIRLSDVVVESFKGVRIALIGGIIINTDYGQEDWFDPRRTEVIDESGSRIPFSIP